jgi:hypothetical protein
MGGASIMGKGLVNKKLPKLSFMSLKTDYTSTIETIFRSENFLSTDKRLARSLILFKN